MRPSSRKWLAALLSLGLLVAAGAQVGPLDALRKKHQLIMPPLPETVRPSMFLSPLLALGRAPLVDYLWLRATQLKEEGRFFDAYQLSEMICELQPKFASVWAFQGWNMSYNISVTLKSPEERWRWVKNGYELIRDRGIPLNPNNTQLYRELAWILFHKVGDFMDEWHSYYKLQFALQMEDILGPVPDGFVRPGQVEGDYYREYDFQTLVDAPQTIEELLQTPGVADFVARLKTFGFDAAADGVYLNLLTGLREGTIQVPDAKPGEEENRLAALRAFMSEPATQEARQAIEIFWRAYRLRNEVKLDPARIVSIEKALGIRLDFRLAESHALYWANLGMEKGIDTRTNFDVHKLNTNRIEFFCLQKMFHRGRLAMSKDAKLGEPPLLAPDIRFVPVLFDAFVRDSAQYLKEEEQKSPVSINFVSGFIGFVRSAILRYHELGMNDEAKHYFDWLKETYPDPMYAKGLDGFLYEQTKFDRDIADIRTTTARVEALIRRGMLQYAYGEDEEAVRYLARAKQVYDAYQKSVVSDRMKIAFTFPQIVEKLADEVGGQMYRGSYEIIRKKLGLPPPPPEPTTKKEELGR
ncbi:MAG TPA: hypothetical protein VJZ71_01865 [Phycisphaerae bacterium]|nr:hypothetical protein [Phycisphaerae bacterium]